MLIQRAGSPNGTRPPQGFAPPSWLTLHRSESFQKLSWPLTRPSQEDLIPLDPLSFTVGHDDFEAEDRQLPSLYSSKDETFDFGWDLEHPKRSVSVSKTVYVEKACVTNSEFLAFYTAQTSSSTSQYNYPLPASWISQNGEIQVRTLYGPVSFAIAGSWPFVGSFDELEAFAHAKGGRMPTEIELRAFLDGYMEANNSSTIGFREWSFVQYVFLI